MTNFFDCDYLRGEAFKIYKTYKYNEFMLTDLYSWSMWIASSRAEIGKNSILGKKNKPLEL